MSETALIQVSQVRRALEQATSVAEVKELRDRAEALKRYVKSSKAGLQAFNQVAEVKLRAERKAGTLLAEMERANSRDNLRRGPKLHDETSGPTLNELGVSKVQSHRWQLAAEVPEGVFEQFVAQTTEREEELTSAALMELARVYRRRTETRGEPLSGGAVFTSVQGSNADLMREVAKLYLQSGDRSRM